jgi:hypothetical protein
MITFFESQTTLERYFVTPGNKMVGAFGTFKNTTPRTMVVTVGACEPDYPREAAHLKGQIEALEEKVEKLEKAPKRKVK